MPNNLAAVRVIAPVRPAAVRRDPAFPRLLLGGRTGAVLQIWWYSMISSEPDQWTQVEQIATPTLLLRSENSPFPLAAMEEMQQRMQNATLIEIPGAAHDIHIEQRDALVNALLNFLE